MPGAQESIRCDGDVDNPGSNEIARINCVVYVVIFGGTFQCRLGECRRDIPVGIEAEHGGEKGSRLRLLVGAAAAAGTGRQKKRVGVFLLSCIN